MLFFWRSNVIPDRKRPPISNGRRWLAWPTALRPRQAEDDCDVWEVRENVISLSAGRLPAWRSRTLARARLRAIRRVFRPVACSAAKGRPAGLPLPLLFCGCPSGSGLLPPLGSPILEPAPAIVLGTGPLYPGPSGYLSRAPDGGWSLSGFPA